MIGLAIAAGLVIAALFAVIVFQTFRIQHLEERIEDHSKLLIRHIEILETMAMTDPNLGLIIRYIDNREINENSSQVSML